MKRILIAVLAGLGLGALLALAESTETTWDQAYARYSIIATTNDSDGVYVYTNTVDHPWHMVSTWARWQDNIISTNTFLVEHVRKTETLFYRGNYVTTNGFGEVETNYYSQVTNTAYVLSTNTLVNIQYTNVIGSLKSVNDADRKIPEYIYVLPGDLLQFSWTRTGLSWTGRVDFGWSGIR